MYLHNSDHMKRGLPSSPSSSSSSSSAEGDGVNAHRDDFIRLTKAMDVSLRNIQEWKEKRGESLSLGLITESEYLDGLLDLKEVYLQLMRDLRKVEQTSDMRNPILTVANLARAKKRIKLEAQRHQEDALVAVYQHGLPPDFWKRMAFLMERDVHACFRLASLSRMHYRTFVVENDFISRILHICNMSPRKLGNGAYDANKALKESSFNALWGVGVEDPTNGFYHHWEWDLYLGYFAEGVNLGYGRMLTSERVFSRNEEQAIELTRDRYRPVLGWKWGNPVQIIIEYINPEDDVDDDDAEPIPLELLPGISDFICRMVYLKQYDMLDWWFDHDTRVPNSWVNDTWCAMYNLFYTGLYAQDYPLVTYLWKHQMPSVIEMLYSLSREDIEFIRENPLSGDRLAVEKAWFSWFHQEVTLIVNKMKASDVREQKIMDYNNTGPNSDLENAGSDDGGDDESYLDNDDPLVLRLPENIVLDYFFTYGGLDRGDWEEIINWIEQHM